MEKRLVNPVALQNCSVKIGDCVAPILDISFVRVVVGGGVDLPPEASGEKLSLEFNLDRYHFRAEVCERGRGEDWLRLGFEKVLPSAKAHLRSFLSPKKIGESIFEDWRKDSLRHYHGLNESELWFDPEGPVLFTYLDQSDYDAQFIIRMTDSKSALRVGKILRKDYIELNNITGELPLLPLTDRDIYAKLGECRDIVTNFRATGQLEYHLKQRLLRVISETLYSTSHKVEMSQFRSRSTSTSMEN